MITDCARMCARMCNCYYSVHRSESLKHTPADNDNDPSHCEQECARAHTHTHGFIKIRPTVYTLTRVHACVCVRESQAELEKMISCCDLRWPFTHTLILVCSLCNPLHACVFVCVGTARQQPMIRCKNAMHVHYIMFSFVLAFSPIHLLNLCASFTCAHARTHGQ
jgi:hypothetical protein